jgi:hypothetical protein
MNCTYTRHARERMAERNITEQEVEATLEDHHTEYPDRAGNRVYIGHPDGRRIKIVVKKDSSPPLIITAAD